MLQGGKVIGSSTGSNQTNTGSSNHHAPGTSVQLSQSAQCGQCGYVCKATTRECRERLGKKGDVMTVVIEESCDFASKTLLLIVLVV